MRARGVGRRPAHAHTHTHTHTQLGESRRAHTPVDAYAHQSPHNTNCGNSRRTVGQSTCTRTHTLTRTRAGAHTHKHARTHTHTRTQPRLHAHKHRTTRAHARSHAPALRFPEASRARKRPRPNSTEESSTFCITHPPTHTHTHSPTHTQQGRTGSGLRTHARTHARAHALNTRTPRTRGVGGQKGELHDTPARLHDVQVQGLCTLRLSPPPRHVPRRHGWGQLSPLHPKP